MNSRREGEAGDAASVDPDDKHTLKALPCMFSGLHLLAITYTTFRQIDLTMDTGADFSAEQQAALEMQEK